MATHLIIDGYNLLGVRGQVGPDSESARERLLRDLSAYRQRKSHSITVVFDGWQQGMGAERREHRAGVEVVYSRRGERADQVIQRLVEEFGLDCAVVSSDREVADFAKSRGAFVMGSSELTPDSARLLQEPRGLFSNRRTWKTICRDAVRKRRVTREGYPKRYGSATDNSGHFDPP